MTDLEHLSEQHTAALKEWDRREKELEALRREVQDAKDAAEEAWAVLNSIGEAIMAHTSKELTNA